MSQYFLVEGDNDRVSAAQLYYPINICFYSELKSISFLLRRFLINILSRHYILIKLFAFNFQKILKLIKENLLKTVRNRFYRIFVIAAENR